jgi:phosphate:Na+ symporter
METDYFKMFYLVLGGLGLFLFGMKQLSQSLQSLGSPIIRKIINYVTANRVLAVIVGTVVTCFVQSSSVSTVMMSGFVNAGLMNLSQAVGFIFGANIGTTITGWIISLKIGKYGLLMIGLGAFPMLFSSNAKVKNISRLMFALGMVFFGLEFMSSAFKPLRGNPDFRQFMAYFSADSPLTILACFGMGCILTMIIQSSSAMLGITIALASQGAITFPTAAALVLGENIGTTVTLWIATIGANKATKRTAMAHTTFNLSGSLIIFCIFPYYLDLIEWLMPNNPAFVNDKGACPYAAENIAAVHTVFNVSMTILFLPFLQYLVKFVQFVIPDEGKEKYTFHYFGSIYDLSPVMALVEARQVTRKMGELTYECLKLTTGFLLSEHADPNVADKVAKLEEKADEMQKEITLFLSNVMRLELTPQQTGDVNTLIRACDELESVTDYCANVVKYRERLDENGIKLSADSIEMLTNFTSEIESFFAETRDALEAMHLEDVEKFVAEYKRMNIDANEIRDRHLQMVQEEHYPPLFGLTFSDIMIALRRIKNHTLNIADAVHGSKTSDLAE